MHTKLKRLMGIDLLDLELFSEVAAAGSITHGAERVHLALPSASTRIRMMERKIGAPLLQRGRHGVTLTPAGRLVLQHARTVLGQLDRMRDDLTQYADRLSATIRLLVNTATATTLVPGDLISFLIDRPDIDIDLAERPSNYIVRAVADGRADIGIVASTTDLGLLAHVPLRSDPLVLAAPPEHELAQRAQTTLAECLKQAFVGLAEGSALQEAIEGHALPLGLRPTYRVRLPSVEAVCQAVAAGIGVAVLPAVAARRWRDTYPLALVPLADPWASRELLLCVSRSAPLSTSAEALVAHLKASQTT